MSENKEKEIIVDIGDQSANQDTENTRDNSSTDELKQQAGELLKAAGGLAGSLGKFAVKKGSQLKEKLEDEEFQGKINNNIKAVTDKIDDYVSSDSAKNRKTVSVKGVIEESKVEQPQAIKQTSKPKEVKSNEIETSFEVEGNETVNFETKKAPKGIAKAIEQGKAERKAAKEKKKAEKERKRKEEQKRSLILGGLGFVLCMIMLAVMGHGGNGHEGQVHAPLSSTDAYDLNYEDVIKQFEDAGFTNVETMKMEDLVIGWLSSDGGVDKITIDGDEEYSTSSWYDPNAKVLVYYHTYPPEATEEPEPEAVKEEASSEDKSKLQAFVGETVAVADSEIKALGYEPKYLALNNGADMTSDIEYSDNKDAWKIKSLGEFDASAKTVSYMVATKEIEEIVEKKESAQSKLSNNEARDIAYKWINNNWSSSFRMKDIPQYSIVDGKIAIWSLCTFKDNSGNKYEGEVIAYVNPDTKGVDLVEIRHPNLGIVWSYGE